MTPLRARLAALKAEQTREDYERVIQAVIDCGSRGDVLPLSQQPQSSCGACELFACGAERGLGETPGVSHQVRCLECKFAEMGITT